MKKKQPSKNNLRLAIVSGVVLVSVFVIAFPFFGANREEKQFRSLSTVMKSIHTSLQNVDTSSSWRYKESCSDMYSGDFPTGDITCAIELSLQTSVTSASAMQNLHQSYYNVVVRNPNLLPDGTLTLSPAATFGKRMVVSTAEARYSVKDLSDITCRYNATLGQEDENSANFTLGSMINSDKGIAFFTVRCSDVAQNYWYAKSN